MGKWDKNRHRAVKGHFLSQEENLLTVEAKIQEKVEIREEIDIFLTSSEHLNIVSLKVHLLISCVNKSHLYLICEIHSSPFLDSNFTLVFLIWSHIYFFQSLFIYFFQSFYPSVFNVGYFLLLCIQINWSFLLQYLIYLVPPRDLFSF